MKIHHYNEFTGMYLGEGVAQIDPLDPENWLIPAHATTIAPSDELEGFTRHFENGAWAYREIPVPEPEPELKDVATAPELDKPDEQ
jgi:hypothetical protein